MNIEIANRLVEFRKKNGLSQEQLAEKIGVSRQAVSKWERSEASPDTDNLILLARLYNVSLDELLSTEDEIPMPEPEAEAEPAQAEEQASGFENDSEQPNQSKNVSFKGGIHVEDGGDKVHIGPDGIHVEDKNGENVHVGWDGIYVNGSDSVTVNGDGVYVNGERVDKCHAKDCAWASFPYAALMLIGFLCLGFIYNAWWWAWLLFLTIPIFHGTVEAICKRKLWKFPYEIFTAVVFLYFGMFYNWWHPAWVVFLTIPFFRWICGALKKKRKKKITVDGVNVNPDSVTFEETFSTEKNQ